MLFVASHYAAVYATRRGSPAVLFGCGLYRARDGLLSACSRFGLGIRPIFESFPRLFVPLLLRILRQRFLGCRTCVHLGEPHSPPWSMGCLACSAGADSHLLASSCPTPGGIRPALCVQRDRFERRDQGIWRLLSCGVRLGSRARGNRRAYPSRCSFL